MAETWRRTVLTFEAAREYADPVRDCAVVATFAGPSGEEILREAYWDGGRTYRVSFAPTVPGSWNWSLAAPADSGLDGLFGTLEAEPYRGELPIYRHGFLRVAENRRHLTYADGTPFLWLGDTHWAFATGERWEESNHPAMGSMFRGMVDRRAEQGFSVCQANLRANEADDRYWLDPDAEKPVPNVAFYQQELDRRMAYVADAGLVNALGFAWYDELLQPNGMERMKTLARYVVARYGALPVVWTLAGEVAGYDPAHREELIAGWDEVARVIESCDGYGHLQTAHYTTRRPMEEYYQDASWHDLTLGQAGHGDYLVGEGDYREFFSAHHEKPFVEGEAMYEGCSTLEENGSRQVTPAMVRRVAYMVMQLGGCGYTYGAQGIWDCVWDEAFFEDPANDVLVGMFNRFHWTWRDGIDAPGAVQLGHWKRFYEDVRFWELAPYERPGANGARWRKQPMATVSEQCDRIAAYYTEAARKPLRVEGLAAGEWTWRWFDSRTGEWGEPCSIALDGTWTLPPRPDCNDWCLTASKTERDKML